ncbi:MAG: LicD family protein [Clostridia bacterium]|nr:LicD family protein [Clostridia bacterium]
MTNDYGNLELHKVLLSAMKDIDKICRENGLKYYLHAGTLLGAFNHQGFIPWDDDVDISLTRNDYDTLLQILQTQYSDKYFVHNYKTDPSYRNNRTVLRVLGTKVIHFHENPDNHHPEIAVDIVPLDAAPDKNWQRKLQQKLIWIFDAAVQIKQGEIIPQSIPTKMLALLSKLDRVRLGETIDSLTMHYNHQQTEFMGLLSYTGKNPYTGNSGYENDLIPRKSYENPIVVPFEDTEFMTIGEPIQDLEHRYGPHWHDPYPEEKRITKHDVKSYEISPEVRARIGL